MSREHLLGLDPAAFERWMAAADIPSYHADQALAWVWRRGVADFASMTDLPEELREILDGSFEVLAGRERRRATAAGGTTKLLLGWPDGATTETVMIPAQDDPAGRRRQRRTVCVSSQVGCDVGCRFCASGIGGRLRDLTVGEVLEQVWRFGAELQRRGERPSHVVFMGMGEPLANYEVTVEAVRRLSAPWCAGLSQRRITVSTVGLPKQIERLAGEDLHVTLALSLHAPEDGLRAELIPWAEGVSLRRLLAACRTYFDRTGREITLEYCLLAGVNDAPAQARDLADIARQLHAHVNLLMYNPVEGLPFERPSRNRAIAFLKQLRAHGAKAHLRESRGLEADAACGQLRRREQSGAS